MILRQPSIPNSPEYYFSITAPGFYLTYPETPKAVYERHIELANNGVVKSMYWVAVALGECEFAENLQAEKDKGNSRQVRLLLNTDQAVAKSERCSGLLELVVYTRRIFCGPVGVLDSASRGQWL